MLVFQIKRGCDWDRALASSPQEIPANWEDFLIRLAIHQSRLRIELYDKDDNNLGVGEISLDALRAKPSAKVAVAANLSERLARIVARP
jgi:hypothetical protein